MKITPKYKIGDLLMCKAVTDKDDTQYKNVLGWITDVKIYLQGSNSMVTYYVQWTDKPETSLTQELTVELLRKYYLETRKEIAP